MARIGNVHRNVDPCFFTGTYPCKTPPWGDRTSRTLSASFHNAMIHQGFPFIALTSALLSVPILLAHGPAREVAHDPGGGGPPITDDRQVTQQQLKCVRDSFATYFHGGSSTTSNTGIVPAQVDVVWSSLAATVNAVTVGTDTVRGVRIHYGLAPSSSPYDYQFTMGVEVVRLVRASGDNWQVLPVEGSFFIVDGNHELQATDRSRWGDDEVYFEHAFVRRTSTATSFDVMNDAVDTRNFLFQWEEELLPLHDDNSTCNGIRFVCIAEPGERDGDIDKNMRHHLCAVALNGGTELVNNDAPVSGHPFRNKAADIGCPCPALCGNALLPEHGTALKNCP